MSRLRINSRRLTCNRSVYHCVSLQTYSDMLHSSLYRLPRSLTCADAAMTIYSPYLHHRISHLSGVSKSNSVRLRAGCLQVPVRPRPPLIQRNSTQIRLFLGMPSSVDPISSRQDDDNITRNSLASSDTNNSRHSM